MRPTFKDPTSITRVNGKPAITIEVSKRTGANLVETVDATRKVVEDLAKTWPSTVDVSFTQDKSKDIRTMLHELQNSVITAVLLVVVIMLTVLGGRASLFIGIAIPASFLTGILALQLAGLTVNIVVLFSLILAVGMLVDDAIIVSEFAERRMSEGMEPRAAYSLAAKRMSGPVIAATATRVAAFSPLLFWPGIVGEFMKYLPLTLIATLSASLAVALFFTPTLGAMLGRAGKPTAESHLNDRGLYMRTVKLALRRPLATLGVAAALLVGVIQPYGTFGNGVEFFPDIEPDYGLVQVRARGNLSIQEKDQLVRQVEQRLLGMPELETVYARSGENQRGSDEVTEDTVGTVQFELVDWKKRRKASVILDEIRAKTSDIPGVIVEVNKPAGRPADRQAGDAADQLRRPRPPLSGGAQGGGDRRRQSRHARRRRRPAASRHRLEARRRQGGGGEIRREPAHRRHRRAARHQRREGLRVPPLHHRQVGRHPGALPGEPAQPRRARPAHRQHQRGRGADRQFRHPHARRRRSVSSTASPARASSPSLPTWRRACSPPSCSSRFSTS